MNKLIYLLLISILFSCKYDKLPAIDEGPNNGYPLEIANILVNKCATEGCHNSASRNNAGGLDFSTWDLMFEGGKNGSSVIPYSVDYSFMLYTVNTDSLKGPLLLPTMPYQQEPLSDAEYQLLVDWIANGAPDKNGFVKFSDDPLRKKVYICMQGCDKVAVIDAKTKVIMRYINVGVNPASIEAPHFVHVSPDEQYWYVVFASGSALQKFRTIDDSLVASLDIGTGNWNTLMISPDGRKGFVNNTADQYTKVVDLNTMTLPAINTYPFDYPHGGFITNDGHYLYLTCQTGNFFYKIDLTDTLFYDNVKISLIPGQPTSTLSSLDPHEMIQSPDGSKYFVSCQRSNEIRVFNTANDSLITSIHVGVKPQELKTSAAYPYVFVTCTEDPISASEKGSVYIINYNNLSKVDSIYTGYQPHGIEVDDAEGLVYVANLNYDPNAPAPHHVSACGGRNGNLTIIDIKLLPFNLYNKTFSNGFSFTYRNELLSFPYYISIRK